MARDRKEYQKKYYEDNIERSKTNAKKHYAKTHLQKWKDNLKQKYGITSDDYFQMLKNQNNVCAICQKGQPDKKGKKLSVDHCHKTGKVRGLLCTNCNQGLGQFRDDTDVLGKAINYLNKSEEL
jgi:hypothetical protein